MASKTYEVGEEGVAWGSEALGVPVQAGDVHEFDLDHRTETALVAAGWLKESEKKKGGK